MATVLMHKRPMYKEQTFVAGIGYIDFDSEEVVVDAIPASGVDLTRSVTCNDDS